MGARGCVGVFNERVGDDRRSRSAYHWKPLLRRCTVAVFIRSISHWSLGTVRTTGTLSPRYDLHAQIQRECNSTLVTSHSGGQLTSFCLLHLGQDFVHWAPMPVAIWNGLDSSVTPPRKTPYDNEAIFTG